MAKEKGLALANQDPQLNELCSELNKNAEQTKQQLMFLKKQAENIMDEANTRKKGSWKRIEDYLRETGKLPKEYNDHTHYLHWDADTSLVAMGRIDEQQCEHPLHSLLSGLAGMMKGQQTGPDVDPTIH